MALTLQNSRLRIFSHASLVRLFLSVFLAASPHAWRSLGPPAACSGDAGAVQLEGRPFVARRLHITRNRASSNVPFVKGGHPRTPTEDGGQYLESWQRPSFVEGPITKAKVARHVHEGGKFAVKAYKVGKEAVQQSPAMPQKRRKIYKGRPFYVPPYLAKAVNEPWTQESSPVRHTSYDYKIPLLNCAPSELMTLVSPKSTSALKGPWATGGLTEDDAKKWIEEGQKLYKDTVTLNGLREQKVKQLKSDANVSKLKIVIGQWNAELILPEPTEIVAPFLLETGEGEGKFNLAEADVFLLFFEENNKYPDEDLPEAANAIVKALNAIDGNNQEKGAWELLEGKNVPSAANLPNNRGTVVRKMVITPNTQTRMAFKRSKAAVEAVQSCDYSFPTGSYKGEKGFVGISLLYKDTWRFTAAGMHLDRKESKKTQMNTVLKELSSHCSMEDGGVALVGDFNTRLSPDTTAAVLQATSMVQAAASSSSLAKFKADVPAPPSEKRPVTPSRAAVTYAWWTKTIHGFINWYRYPLLPAKKFISMMDPLSASQGDDSDIREPLREKGFTEVSACFASGPTFEYTKECGALAKEANKKGKEHQQQPPVSFIVEQCLDKQHVIIQGEMEQSHVMGSTKSTSFIDTGYLDRIVIRQPKPAPVQTAKGSAPKTAAPTSSKAEIIVERGAIALNTRSDHPMMIWQLSLVAHK